MSAVSFHPGKNIFIADTIYVTREFHTLKSRKLFVGVCGDGTEFLVGVVGGISTAGLITAAVKKYIESKEFVDLKIEGEANALVYIPTRSEFFYYDNAADPVEIFTDCGVSIGAHATVTHLLINTVDNDIEYMRKATNGLPAHSNEFTVAKITDGKIDLQLVKMDVEVAVLRHPTLKPY